MINVNISEENLKKVQIMMKKAPDDVEMAARNALNRTLISIRKEISVNIRKNYEIKAKDIKNALNLKHATSTSLTAEVKSYGSPRILQAFRVTMYKPSRKGYIKPPRARVLKTSNMKIVRGMFVNSKGYLSQRITKKRYPLRTPYGPSVPQMMESKKVIDVIKIKAQDTLNNRFLHEIEYRFGKLGD